MQNNQLLASAGSLDAIRDCVCKFYCGESKTLIPDGANAWAVVGTFSGKSVSGVRVRMIRNRYRFETFFA